MKMTFALPSLFLFSLLAMSSLAQAAPLALVYEGPGSCAADDGDCTGAAEKAAEAAGYEVVRVGPKVLGPGSSDRDYDKIFSKAVVWVQPGGGSKSFLDALSPETRAAIRRFVAEGGGYVGFCAGAFSATDMDGMLDLKGLGIFPGKTHSYPNQITNTFVDYIVSKVNKDAYNNQTLELTWNQKVRHVYFEEGPYLNLDGIPAGEVEIIARYKNGQVATARALFGKGRVYVTGSHPEAPSSWKHDPDLADADGPDLDLVKEMLDWARAGSDTKLNPGLNPPSSQVIKSVPKPAGSYVGIKATYATYSRKKNDKKDTLIGNSELKVVGYDQKSDSYSVQITQTFGKDVTHKVSAIEAKELASYEDGSFYQDCGTYGGVSESTSVRNTSIQACKIASSNIQMYFGKTPFSLLKAVSKSAKGETFTTTLLSSSQSKH